MKQATPNSLLLKLDLHPPEAFVNRTDMKYVFYTYLEPKWISEADFRISESLYARKSYHIPQSAIHNPQSALFFYHKSL